MGFDNLNDDSILRLYESVRSQVDADCTSQYKFMIGPSVKQYATILREELTRRHLQRSPIEWPRDW
jgi:hypothetical protein